MATYRTRVAAENDLVKIGIDSRAGWGDAQMRVYLAEIVATFDQLAAMPNLGRTCDELFTGCRRFPVGQHVIFYEIASDGVVEIVNVLHGRMQHDLHIGADE